MRELKVAPKGRTRTWHLTLRPHLTLRHKRSYNPCSVETLVRSEVSAHRTGANLGRRPSEIKLGVLCAISHKTCSSCAAARNGLRGRGCFCAGSGWASGVCRSARCRDQERHRHDRDARQYQEWLGIEKGRED